MKDSTPLSPELMTRLEQRLGKVHARQRVGVEQDHTAQVFGFGRNLFHLENWYSIHGIIRGCLRLAGLYQRGKRNTCRIDLRHHPVVIPHLPAAFEGFRILHLSDLHVDMYAPALHALIARVREVQYDLCVLTGDYRARTFGTTEGALNGMRQLRTHLQGDVYGVLGNHDSVTMVPALEDMGIRLLLNESVQIHRGDSQLFLAGIDDAHYFRVDNIEKATVGREEGQASILLSHTPAIFRQAAHAGFDLFLAGHTHGGQICLPGGIPVTLDSDCPRRVGKGPWKHHGMTGYTSVGAGTSVVHVRLNCNPEITLHELRRA